jgi:site-specific DNA-methyltransferase (adenine-specific)
MSKNVIKYGDIFQLGDHRLVCGDATDSEIVSKLLREDKIKLILTDVPYGVALVEGKKGFTKSKQEHVPIENDHIQSDQEFKDFTSRWLDPIKDLLERKNTYYIFNSDKMMFPMREALLDQGFKFSQLLVWVKTGAVIGRLDYLPQHELIAYGWRGTHEFLKSKDKSILISPKTKKNDLHPTMKPISILRRLILNSSRTKDFVYDCFGGSGSTLIACEQTKRKCLMVELSPEYCQVIIDRWEKLTALKAKKL